MDIAKNATEFVFSFALFINALLFIPQAVRIFKKKSAEGVSLLTFFGFLLIQFAIILHGIINRDYLLTIGYLFSVLTCGTVVGLILMYNKRRALMNNIGPKKVLKQLPVEMLERIIAMMPGHVYWVDKEGFYLGCNDNQAKSAGLSSRKEIIGKRNQDLPWNFNAGVLPATLDEINKEVIETRKLITVEEPALLQDGTEAMFLSNKVSLCNENGETIGMVGISIDITERKKAEKALKAAKEMIEITDKAKAEFLSGMRHDLLTPFTGILSLADLLESKETDPEKKKTLSYITQSAKGLLEQLNEIFEFVEVENGQLPILEKEFDMRIVLNAVFSMMLPLAKSKELDFTLTIDSRFPNYVVGDHVRTQRILMNLVNNSIKYTEKGHVKIEAKATRKSDEKIVATFIIEDTGIGIPKDKQDIIFERFNRLVSSYDGVYPGKGLGLRIVKQFLDEINAQFYLDSKVGEGTTFKVVIPYKLPLLSLVEDDNVQEIQTNKKVEKRPNLPRERSNVLLVEDNQIVAIVTKMILVELNCETDVAENGKTAIELLEKNHYDLVFMDIGLTGMDGYAITKKIRSHRTASIRHVPIVTLTAHVDSANKQRCLDASMNAVIIKPLIKEQVEHILDMFIPRLKEYEYVEHVPQENHVEIINEPEEKIVDFEYAKKLLGGNETVVHEMLTMLVDSFPHEVEMLEQAYQQKNWEEVGNLAHKLIGSSGYCGTLRLKAICTELENYIRSGLTARIPALYQKVLSEIQAVQKFQTQSAFSSF